MATPDIGQSTPGQYWTPGGEQASATAAAPISTQMTPQLQQPSQLNQLSDMPSGGYGTSPVNIQTPVSQQIGNFMQSPWGQLTSAAVPAITGLVGANQARALGNQVAGTIPAAVAPATSLGAGISNQLQTGQQMGGPIGASIAQQTGAAQQLGNVAQQYASGNLTQAQLLQLQQATAGAGARANLAFAQSGNPMSSAAIAEQQNIQNQGLIAEQQMQQNNITLATQALTSVQNTYGQLTNQVMNAAGLGGNAANAAAHLVMQNNQQIQTQIQNLWQQITKGMLGAAGGQQSGQTGQTGTASSGTDWGTIVKNILSGNQQGAVNPSSTPGTTTAQTPSTGVPSVPQLSSMPQFNFDLGSPNYGSSSSTDSGTPQLASNDGADTSLGGS